MKKPYGAIEREKETVHKMVLLYCRKNHSACLCKDCEALISYAHARLDRCRYGEHKTTCAKCPTHCYRPDMRERIKQVMRFSGPRMLLYHPLDAIRHLFHK